MSDFHAESGRIEAKCNRQVSRKTAAAYWFTGFVGLSVRVHA